MSSPRRSAISQLRIDGLIVAFITHMLKLAQAGYKHKVRAETVVPELERPTVEALMTPADAGIVQRFGRAFVCERHGVKQFNLASLEQTLNLFTRFGRVRRTRDVCGERLRGVSVRLLDRGVRAGGPSVPPTSARACGSNGTRGGGASTPCPEQGASTTTRSKDPSGQLLRPPPNVRPSPLTTSIESNWRVVRSTRRAR